MKVPRELRSMVRKWQKLLGLTDWTIRLAVSERSRGSDGLRVAEVEKVPENRSAVIYFYQDAFDEDLDDSVIHELVHLHFATFRNEPETPAGDAEEHAIYAISACIAKLAREAGM